MNNICIISITPCKLIPVGCGELAKLPCPAHAPDHVGQPHLLNYRVIDAVRTSPASYKSTPSAWTI